MIDVERLFLYRKTAVRSEQVKLLKSAQQGNNCTTQTKNRALPQKSFSDFWGQLLRMFTSSVNLEISVHHP